MSNETSLFAELRRRKVIRTTIFYAAFAWAAIEVVTTLLPVFGGRDTVVRILVALILVGLPVAVAVSWIFDFTPNGLRRTEGADSGGGGVAGVAAVEVVDADRAVLSRPPPSPPTPLVGREDELGELVSVVQSGSRVVTLTGPGGTGKTRLAIAAAEALGGSFPDGVAYVELAAVSDASEVVPTVAGALGVKEAATRSLAEGLATVIGSRRALLVLDNLEQVIEAAPELAALVRACPAIHLLSTSRAPLRIAGEVEVPLKPLELPPQGRAVPLEDADRYAAVALFLDRTRRARPGFRLDQENVESVVAICRRLDGLPLALELAAARLRALEPAALLQRLGHALDVLTTGGRDLPERQRTLRGTVDWSHSLLDDPEQRLFRRLAVFAGGFTRDAVEPVCYDDEEGAPLDAFESLVEQGLVHPADGARRFGMLETIREYALERLVESEDEEGLRSRHAMFFASLVNVLYSDLRTGRQVESLTRGDAEAANIEAALELLHARAASGDRVGVEAGLGMCADLWLFWHIRGLHIRAREWARRFLAEDRAPGPSQERARALFSLSVASLTLGDSESTLAEVEEGMSVASPGDAESRSLLELSRGVTLLTIGRLDAAREALAASIGLARELDGTWELGMALTFMGMVLGVAGEVEASRAALEEALSHQRPLDDYEGMGGSISALAALEARAANPERALELYQESFDAYHTIGDRPEEARVLDAYAWTALSLDRVQDARHYFAESLRAYQEVGSVRGVGIALLGLAATRGVEGDAEEAVRIAGAAATFSEQEGVANDYALSTDGPRYLDAARRSLDPGTVERLEAEGRGMSVPEAVARALEPTSRPLQPTLTESP